MGQSIKNAVICTSTDWSVPAGWKDTCGVLVAKSGPDMIAIYEPVSGLGWAIMTHKQWIKDFKTEFPTIPYTNERAGWALIPFVERWDGSHLMTAVLQTTLVYALQDDVSGLRRFKREFTSTESYPTMEQIFARPPVPFVCPKVVKTISPALHAGCRPTVALARY